jgi:hypothetical protein
MRASGACRAFSRVAHTWGSTAAERAQPFPCDGLVPAPSQVLFRAVDVAAPASVLFRWLCQLKVAPYSYDWLDNGGRRSPRRLIPGLEVLAVGQRVIGLFELAAFERDRHLTVLLRAPASRMIGPLAASYTVVPRGPGSARLVVKVVLGYPRGPIGWALARLVPWADLVMMRKQLLTLKALAETKGSA